MSSTSYDVVNPATEEVVTTVPLADVEETDAAVAAAKRAFPAWRDVPPGDRAAQRRRLADALADVLREKSTEPAGEAGMQWTDGALQEAAEVPLFLRARARRLAEERARKQGSGEVTREIFLESRS